MWPMMINSGFAIKVPSNMKLMCYSSCDYNETATEMVFNQLLFGEDLKNLNQPNYKSDFAAL